MAFCNGMHTGSRFARHESEQTSNPGASLRESLENRFDEERQMTVLATGASSTAYTMCIWLLAAGVYRKGYLSIFIVLGSWVGFNQLLKGLSCMMGNYHVQFLGGKGP